HGRSYLVAGNIAKWLHNAIGGVSERHRTAFVVKIRDRVDHALTFEPDHHEVRESLVLRLLTSAPAHLERRIFHESFELALHFHHGLFGMGAVEVQHNGDALAGRETGEECGDGDMAHTGQRGSALSIALRRLKAESGLPMTPDHRPRVVGL